MSKPYTDKQKKEILDYYFKLVNERVFNPAKRTSIDKGVGYSTIRQWAAEERRRIKND